MTQTAAKPTPRNTQPRPGALREIARGTHTIFYWCPQTKDVWVEGTEDPQHPNIANTFERFRTKEEALAYVLDTWGESYVKPVASLEPIRFLGFDEWANMYWVGNNPNAELPMRHEYLAIDAEGQ